MTIRTRTQLLFIVCSREFIVVLLTLLHRYLLARPQIKAASRSNVPGVYLKSNGFDLAFKRGLRLIGARRLIKKIQYSYFAFDDCLSLAMHVTLRGTVIWVLLSNK